MWRDFFHLELYRHLPMETRFKQKVRGYVAYAASTLHQELFHTSALSIAVICPGAAWLAQTLKRWTEEVLTQLHQAAEGQRFFFSSINVATASPTALYLAPNWQQAFSSTATPLLVLKEEGDEEGSP
jgi:hypothetical protein